MKVQVHETVSNEIAHGVYEAMLEAVSIFTGQTYETKTPQTQMTFVWILGEDEQGDAVRFYDAYIPLLRKKGGEPMVGNTKLYNRVSALHGERFDDRANVDFVFEIDDGYNINSLEELPTTSKDTKEEERIYLKSLLLFGQELLGKSCNIEIGNPEKPGGGKSEKTKVVDASPLAKKANFRKPAPQQPAKK